MLLVKVFIHILKIFTACHPNDILPEGTSRPLTAAASSLRQSLFSTELPGCHSGSRLLSLQNAWDDKPADWAHLLRHGEHRGDKGGGNYFPRSLCLLTVTLRPY